MGIDCGGSFKMWVPPTVKMVGDGVFQDYDGVWLGVNKVNMILRHPAVLSYHYNIIILAFYSLPLLLYLLHPVRF